MKIINFIIFIIGFLMVKVINGQTANNSVANSTSSLTKKYFLKFIFMNSNAIIFSFF